MENQVMADKLIQLEEILREQQAELISLREALAQKKANHWPTPVQTLPPVSDQPKAVDTIRRKMLKRMGLAVLAGGAALGVTAATYTPAEARIIVNPSSNPNVGAVITRNGKSIINIPTASNYGLVASADDSFNVSATGALAITGMVCMDLAIIAGMVCLAIALAGLVYMALALALTHLVCLVLALTGLALKDKPIPPAVRRYMQKISPQTRHCFANRTGRPVGTRGRDRHSNRRLHPTDYRR